MKAISDARLKKLKAEGKFNGTTFAASAPRKATKRQAGRASSDPDDETVQLVLRRDDWKCAGCGDPIVGRRGIEYSIHHRKRRSQGVDNGAANLVTLCGHGTSGCHGHAHSEIAAARLSGMLLRSTENPAEMPMEHAIHGHVLLLDDGTWQRVEAEFIPALPGEDEEHDDEPF